MSDQTQSQSQGEPVIALDPIGPEDLVSPAPEPMPPAEPQSQNP